MANELTVSAPVLDANGVDDEADDRGYVPEGWESAEEFLAHVRKTFDDDAGYDKDNRTHAIEDLRFLAGDQWDATVLADRTAKGRPCLTINVLPQFVGQVIGDRRLNKTSIKITPKKDATAAEAEVRSGIIKGIEAESRADRVYDAACEDQVGCGIGNFRIEMEYAYNDVFDQDIVIRHIPNPLAVVWDRMSVDPTGRDARHCFVQDIMPKDVYDEMFPDHPSPAALSDMSDMTMLGTGWFSQDSVRITEFWEMIDKPATFALMADGDIKDVTGMALDEYQDQLWRHPSTFEPKIRKSYRTYARMHLVSGEAILSGPYELPLSRLPIIRVEGRVVRVGEDRVRFGLVRFAKDSQRLKNYWRSVAAETLAMAPKAQWVAREDSVEGREDEWRQSHLKNDPLMIYNKNTEKPERADPATVPAALLQEAQMNQQDIKDTTGIQDASLGMRSNEISGRAIQARQKEGDVATIIYHDNLNAAILEGGDVVNQLIPLAFDTMRQVLIIGDDDKRKLVTINDPTDDASPNISTGKYDVSLSTGPSFSTQREEARESMTALVQTAPDLFAIAGDLIVKAQDWPGATEIAERLKAQMQKQGIIPPEEDPNQPGAGEQPPEPTQEELAAMQMQEMQMQQANEVMEHESQMRQMALQEQALKLAEAEARVKQANAATRTAEANAEKAEAEARFAPVEHAHKISLAERTASAKASDLSDRGAGSRPGGDRRTPRRTKKD